MNTGPTARIKALLKNLPDEDIARGEKFLKARDFDSLRLLVKSAIHSIDKALLAINPTEKQKELLKQFSFESERLAELRKLRGEVEEYIEFLKLILDDLTDPDDDCS